MFFYNLLNDHYWILVILLFIIGSLPIFSVGIMLIKRGNKKGFAFIGISSGFIFLSMFDFVRSKYLGLIVPLLVIISILSNWYLKHYINKIEKE